MSDENKNDLDLEKKDFEEVSPSEEETVVEVSPVNVEQPEYTIDDVSRIQEKSEQQPLEEKYVSKYPTQADINEQSPFYASTTSPKPSKKTSKKKGGAWVAVGVSGIACSVVLLALLVFFLMFPGNGAKSSVNGGKDSDKSLQPNITQQETPKQESSSTQAVDGVTKLDEVTLLQKVLPSVVEVNVVKTTGSGSGSGVIMSVDGYVLTNAHVLENATKITIVTNDGTEHAATVIGYDSPSDTGVAKMEGTFQPAVFGDAKKVVPGETVIAVGTPYSTALFQTATKGMVSATRSNLSFQSLGLTLDVIQHDAAINSGNSGGPLFNMYGQVIGINSVKMSGVFENLSFAIQINGMLDVAQDLTTKGAVEKPMIGISGKTEPNMGGVLVAELTENGSAKAAGMMPGDIITKLNGSRIKSIDELTSTIRDFEIGDEVSVTVIRDGELLEFTLKLKSSLE